MKDLGKFKDDIIGANYELQIYPSAKILSDDLKSVYKSIKVDFNQFNTSNDGGDVSENPPIEIYEYQNFFLLERTDGKKVLLDGFRRLLWYKAPNTPILVRTYKQSELTQVQILTLLVNLNHFKFFSDSSYQERGFGLLLKTVFDIDITKFRSAFDAYLSSEEKKNSYVADMGENYGTEKIETIKERILNPLFIEDMKFLSVLKEKGCMVNSFFGAFLYKRRTENDQPFDADKFLSLHENDKVLADVLEKYKKVGTNSSVKSQEAVNRTMEIYANYFILMQGGVVEKSYAEKLQECKDIRTQINKDKAWIKLTGSQKYYETEREMANAGVDNLEFKCLVFPKEESPYSYGNRGSIPLQYGLNDLVRFLNKEQKNFMREEMVFGFTDPNTGASWRVRHNYGGYNSYGKKYTYVEYQYDKKISEKFNHNISSIRYDIELWVKINNNKA